MNVYEYTRASIQHPMRSEDATLVHTENGTAPIFAVIDGMGGHQHILESGQVMTGQDASQLIRTSLLEDLHNLPADIDASPNGEAEKRVLAAIQHAHKRVLYELNDGATLSVRYRIGAVMTLAVVCENGRRLFVAQVGDSRAYLYSGGDLIQLCDDEDNVELLLRSNGINEDDAARVGRIINLYDGVNEPEADGKITIGGREYDLRMAWRWFLTGYPALNIFPANVVINSLGNSTEDPVAETSRIEIAPGDLLCVCSDGLYKNLSDPEIVARLRSGGDVAQLLGDSALLRSQDETNKRMNPDDISVIVAHF